MGRLNYNIKGRELKSGDLKTAARTVLPGLVGKMQQDMKLDGDMMSRKEKVQSFTKVLSFDGKPEGSVNKFHREILSVYNPLCLRMCF